MLNPLIKKYVTRRLIKYVVVGLISLAIEYAIFLEMYYSLHLGIVVSQSVSYLTALAANYLGTNYITFSSRAKQDYSHKRQVTYYVVLASVNLLLTNVAMHILVSNIHIDPMIAKIIVIGMVVSWNYALFSKVIFRRDE